MATLKISELSVGDWVGYNGKSYRTVIVDALDQTATIFGNDEQGDIHIEQLAPIPITAEILEKNGLERSTSQFIVYHTDKVWISYDKPSETWSVTMYINDVTSNLHANINYIHQLQHALRLAGVDKEINL